MIIRNDKQAEKRIVELVEYLKTRDETPIFNLDYCRAVAIDKYGEECQTGMWVIV